MYATVVRADTNTLPRIYGPYYSLESALQAVVPSALEEAVIYDLDRPSANLFEIAGRIFPSGRKHVREEYRLEMSG